jgi:topoisomerase IA-like protein
MPPTRFGVLAVGERTFVRSLRAGRSPRLVTVDRVRKWMAHYAAPFKAKAEQDRKRAASRAAYGRRKAKIAAAQRASEQASASAP